MSNTIKNLTYLSLFSGIESASCALEPKGWKALGFAEINPFNNNLLKTRYPDVPLLGDITKTEFIENITPMTPDLLIGGSPCQSYSLAGKRGSLTDPRGQLMHRYVDTANITNPTFVLWENVLGALSTKDNAFGYLLAGLASPELEVALEPKNKKNNDFKWNPAGYVKGSKRTIAWRVLTASYTGVAQSRQRVFLLAVDNEKIKENPQLDPLNILMEWKEGSHPHSTKLPKKKLTLENSVFCTSQDITPRAVFSQTAYTLRAGNHGVNTIYSPEKNKLRKLTPNEMEKLMGFKPDYTNVPFSLKGKHQKASYADRAFALGNSFAVSIIEWISDRMMLALDHKLPAVHNMMHILMDENHKLQENQQPSTLIAKLSPVNLIDVHGTVFTLNASEAPFGWEEKFVSFKDMLDENVPDDADCWLSIRNTMGILDRIKRKKIKVSSDAQMVLDKLENSIILSIKEKITNNPSGYLLNIELGFLIAHLEKSNSLLADKLRTQYYITPKSNEGVGSNTSNKKINLPIELMSQIKIYINPDTTQ